jgi:hypothetical protein
MSDADINKLMEEFDAIGWFRYSKMLLYIIIMAVWTCFDEADEKAKKSRRGDD